ncbi:hypothetical protein HYT55_03445 [Candidatus Woesearchaeota archaeon]|nr:hypothetical protein [Candidatus Woesearchaeota archaeon]
MNILATAKETLAGKSLRTGIHELQARSHAVTIYATGNESEAKGFGDLKYNLVQPSPEDINRLVSGFDCVITGASGEGTSDRYFVNAANQKNIPSISVNTRDGNYAHLFGSGIEDYPTVLAIMDEQCRETLVNELGDDVGQKVAARTRIVGWTAFDELQLKKDSYDNRKREAYLTAMRREGVILPETIYSYFSTNVNLSRDPAWLGYELAITTAVFEAASDLGLRLVVKPHPREMGETEKLVNHHDFVYSPPQAGSAEELMLASTSILASRSTVLTEACLLDRNTGALLPGIDEIHPFPAVDRRAIPYTQHWNEIPELVRLCCSPIDLESNILRTNRKRFAVDGEAGKRLADVVEELFSTQRK